MDTYKDKREWWEYVVLVIAFALIVIGLSSCKQIQYVPIEKETERIVTITERDTTIIVEQDKATLLALLTCDSMNNVLLSKINQEQGNRTYIDYSIIQDDKQALLHIDCKTDSLELEIELRDCLIQELIREKEVILKPPEPTRYQKTMIAFGWIFICYIVVKLIRLFKHHLRIF